MPHGGREERTMPEESRETRESGMPEPTRALYAEVLEQIREIYQLTSIGSLLGWDQQVMMPPKAAPLRAAQSAALTGIVHDRLTSPRLAEALAGLAEQRAQLDPDAWVNVRETRRVSERARKVPRELAQEIAHTQTLSQEVWVAARARSDFAHFAPWLEKMIALRRREADAIGYATGRYDTLLDEYEPAMTAAQIEGIFNNLRPQLVELVQAIRASGVQPNREVVRRRFPTQRQREFALWAIRRLGYDFSAGRVDVSAHPMTIGNLTDVRLTTRFEERYLPMGLFGLMHEAGHGMYEQGFDERHQGTPRAEAVSLGIHESQSRLWENLVGRSHAFWRYAFPYLQAFFPEESQGITLEDWYGAINEVKPSLIRVEADEVTYNLHIILRFDIEKALVEEEIQVADLPSIWNEKTKEYLGIVPENDAQGVLQDIHWSIGLIGYFPTYALGNLYGAQFLAAAQREFPDLQERFAGGDFQTLKAWLSEKIHRPGQTHRAHELVQVVTGEALDARYLIEHLRTKFGALYRF
jgi:carboxypeptidase Taq